MRFDVDPVPGETARACGALAREVLPASRASVLLAFLYVAAVGAALVLARSTAFATSVIAIAGILGTAIALQTEGQARIRKLFEQDPHSQELHHVELSAEGVRTWCSHVEARYPWADFAKITEDQEFYLFVRPNGTGAAIPKRLVDNARDIELRTRLGEWAPDARGALAPEPRGSRAAI